MAGRRGAWALPGAVLAVIAACGGGATPLPECGAPGAGWLAFIHGAAGPFSVVVARQDGACARTVSDVSGNALSPSWSASAHALAYSGTDAGVAAIRVHHLATGVTSTVAVAPVIPGNVALSPDGTKVAFDGRVGAGRPEVYVVPVAGGDPVVVGSSAAIDTGPAWSPDGGTLYFVSDRATGVPEIWSVPADGLLDPVPVTSGSRVLGVPAISPDGLFIAYARRKPDGSSQIVERHLPSALERVLSDQRDGEPAYDATGSRLAVSTYRYGTADVAVIDATTGALVSRVTAGAGANGAPAFPR